MTRDPGPADALSFARRGDFEGALAAIEGVLRDNPGDSSALALKGAFLLELGRRDEALAACDQAIGHEPENGAAHLRRGDVLRELRRPGDAVGSYDRAVELAPSDVAARVNRGITLFELGSFEPALADFDRAIALSPHNPAAHSNRAAALNALERHEEALAAADCALAADSRRGTAWVHRAQALSALDRQTEAFESFGRATQASPQNAQVLYDVGCGLLGLGRYELALRALDASIVLKPDEPLAHFRRSQVRLLTGDYAGGWQDYERRWAAELFTATSAGFAVPAVRERLTINPSADDLRGRSVLLIGEQGVGDQIMFASMIPDLLEVASDVTCICDRRLVGLFSNSFPGVRFFDSRDEAPDLRAGRTVVAMGSLGAAFRASRESFPGSPFLRPRAETIARWRETLGPRDGRLRVGLSWRGGLQSTRQSARSMDLASLEPLLDVADCEFFSLQYGDPRREIAAVNASLSQQVRAFQPTETDDFEDPAALMANLDLVVSVQNATVHLAGAIGQTCLAMLPRIPEWRYGAASPQMPWYGSVELFRQSGDGQWGPVVEAAAAAVLARRRP